VAPRIPGCRQVRRNVRSQQQPGMRGGWAGGGRAAAADARRLGRRPRGGPAARWAANGHAAALRSSHQAGRVGKYASTPASSTLVGALMLIVTTNDIPGYRVDEVLGEVFGLTVRSRNAFSQVGAGLKSILGGELRGMTQALVESRNQVMQRLIDEATARGGNAILAMRFDTSEMGQVWTEICAYGTAVRVTKI
jgi:uncharacterized protein YbjQ (UPF0145 family)